MHEAIDKLAEAATQLEASLEQVAKASGMTDTKACHDALQKYQAVAQAIDATAGDEAKNMLRKVQQEVNYDTLNQQMAGHALLDSIDKECASLVQRIEAMTAALNAVAPAAPKDEVKAE